jgi:hypothetical protein
VQVRHRLWWFGGLAVVVLVAGASAWGFRNSRVGGCRDLGEANAIPENSVAAGGCAPVFVVHGVGDDFAVYLALAPHLDNEPLEWNPRKRLFEGLHGEEFDVTGSAVRGPAAHGLWRCPFNVLYGHLVVDVDRGAGDAQIAQACQSRFTP